MFFEQQAQNESEETVDNTLADMDGINDSIDLANTQTNNEGDKNDENDKNDKDDKNDENDTGNKTDDDCASTTSRRSEAVDYTKSAEFDELQREINRNLMCAVRLQLKNSSALVRRVVILLLDFLGTTNKNIDSLLTCYVSRLTIYSNTFKFIVQF